MVPLMCYGIRLENVTTLIVRIYEGTPLQHLHPYIMSLLKGFDFTRVFPKLSHVTIYTDCACWFSLELIRAFIEQGNGMLEEASPDRIINIKYLTLLNPISDSTALFLAQMFPDVKKLSMFARKNSRDIPFTSLWDHFKYLTELEVVPTGRRLTSKDLDSVFCGIFPEEVAMLREKDDEYLKDVNIVPVMPSIACMRDLRTFTLRYTAQYSTPYGSDPSSIFSKVTCLIGFARCPGLTVKFEAPCKHSSKFAKDDLQKYLQDRLTELEFVLLASSSPVMVLGFDRSLDCMPSLRNGTIMLFITIACFVKA